MPYKHSGEIGDVWKHLPLCDILQIELPKRYFETNAAFAEYILPITDQTKYGIFYAFEQVDNKTLQDSTYLKILNQIDFHNSHQYYGSPALSMAILLNEDTKFFFHDIEEEPLTQIEEFSNQLKIQNKVFTIIGDSISSFLQDNYCFDQNDLVFIDPYSLFDCNDSGKTYFDVFIKAYKSHAKTVLWYGYDNLIDKNSIIEKLKSISNESADSPIYTFDVWQKCMGSTGCKINPGVPGCGIAVANLSSDSFGVIQNYLYAIHHLYRKVNYKSESTTLNMSKMIL